MDSKAAVSVTELLTSELGSVSGPTEIEGWLVGDTGTKNAWLAASEATFDVVAVQLDESTQIYELMLGCGISSPSIQPKDDHDQIAGCQSVLEVPIHIHFHE